jgi:hypothetical protein
VGDVSCRLQSPHQGHRRDGQALWPLKATLNLNIIPSKPFYALPFAIKGFFRVLRRVAIRSRLCTFRSLPLLLPSNKRQMGSARCTLSSDDMVIKSPNDRRLYRLIELENGLRALLVHDPEIYPDGPPETLENGEQVEEECDEDGEDSEGEDEDSEEEEEEEEEGEEEEGEGEDHEVEGKGKKGASSQTKKVSLCFSTFESAIPS